MTFFVLGSHPELSLAELSVVLRLPVSDFSVFGEAAVTQQTIPNAENLQNRLGGVIKIGTILQTLSRLDKKEVAEAIAGHILKQSGNGKIKFGISAYAPKGKIDRRWVTEMGLETKKRVADAGRSVRYVSSKDSGLSSVIVATNHLIESGGEYVLIKTNDGYLLGQTQTVQNFREWSRRDYDRPGFDPKSGMLPPKVARMMINLSGTNPTATILDPFCGSGTIPMEAVVLGFKKIIAADVSERAVADTRKNIAWLDAKAQVQTMQGLAEKLTLTDLVDTIVTEPYLGPPLKGHESAKQIDLTVRGLTALYKKSFSHLSTLLKPQGKAVVAFPLFRKTKTSTFNAVEADLKRIGFVAEGRFLYERADQHVGREIVILSKP